MMPRNTKQGSVLIMVLSVTTAIMLLAVAVLRSSMYGLDFAHERVKYMQQQSATHGLMQYALACAQEHYDAIAQEPHQISMTVDRWATVAESTTYQGRIEIGNKEPLTIRVALMRAGKVLNTLSCELHRIQVDKKNQFLVRNWTVHGDNQKSSTH